MPDSAVSTAKVSFLVHLLLEGLQRSGGLLFVATREWLGCSRQLAAIPFVLSRVVSGSVGGLFRFQKEGRSPLPSVGWGCFLSAVGMSLCFLATDIVWLSVFWGIIFGAGIGLTSPQLVSEQAKRKDGRVKSPLRLTGPSWGCIVLPFIINGLVDHYGINGCYSMLSGVILNCLPLVLIATYQIKFRWPRIKWRLRRRSKRYEMSGKQEITSNVSIYKPRGIKEFCNQSFIQNLEPDTIVKMSDSGSQSAHSAKYIDILQPIIEAKLEMAKDQVNDREPFGLKRKSQNMARCGHGMLFSNELSELAKDVKEYEKNRTMYEQSFSDNDVIRNGLEACEKYSSSQNSEEQEIISNNNDSFEAREKSNNCQNIKEQEIIPSKNYILEAQEKTDSSQNIEVQEIVSSKNDIMDVHVGTNSSQNCEEQETISSNNDNLEIHKKSNGSQNIEEQEIILSNNDSLENREKSNSCQKNKEQGIAACSSESLTAREESYSSQNNAELEITSCNKESSKDCEKSSRSHNYKEQIITSGNNNGLEACGKSICSMNNIEQEVTSNDNDKNESDFIKVSSKVSTEKTSEKGGNKTDNPNEGSPPTIACTNQTFQIKTEHPNPLKERRTNFPLEIKVHVVECTITTTEDFSEILSNKGPSASRKGYRRHSNSLITACYENIDFTQLFLNGKSSPLHKQQWNQASRMCLISEEGESNPGSVNWASGSREVQTQTGTETSSKGRNLVQGFQRLAKPSCLAVLYASVIYEFSLAVLLTIFLDFARDTGDVTVMSSAVLVVFGLGGVIGQLSFSHWGSRLMVDGSHAAAAVMFMLNGLAVAGILWSANVAWLSGFYTLLGFVESGIMITLPQLILDYTDHRSKELLSLTCSGLSVIAFLCIPCAIGQSRDVTGDYDGLLQVISCMSVLCAVLCYFLPKWNGGKNTREEFQRNVENAV